MNHNSIFTQISEFLEQTQYGPDSQPIFEERPLEIEIQVKNNLASVWVLYTAKFGSEENLLEWTGWDLFSMIQHQNQWLITSITFLGEE